MTEIYLRPLAWWRDARFAWRLASDPAVIESSLSGRGPTLLHHLVWLWQWGRTGWWWYLGRAAWVIEGQWHKRVKLGVVRMGLDPVLPEVEIHIALRSEVRGQGLGAQLLAEVSRKVAERGVRPLVARVRWENQASVKAFARAGFEVEGWEDGNVVKMEYRGPA